MEGRTFGGSVPGKVISNPACTPVRKGKSRTFPLISAPAPASCGKVTSQNRVTPELRTNSRHQFATAKERKKTNSRKHQHGIISSNSAGAHGHPGRSTFGPLRVSAHREAFPWISRESLSLQRNGNVPAWQHSWELVKSSPNFPKWLETMRQFGTRKLGSCPFSSIEFARMNGRDPCAGDILRYTDRSLWASLVKM
jgi:hypothetical protein